MRGEKILSAPRYKSIVREITAIVPTASLIAGKYFWEHQEILQKMLPLQGKTIVDVGCGSGYLTKFMAKFARKAIGIDCSPTFLKELNGSLHGRYRFIAGCGEDLPLRNESIDLVIYLNSFHHVQREQQQKALHEAWRVLKDKGFLYIAEPEACGLYFAVTKIVDNESNIRAHAYQSILRAKHFTHVSEKYYFQIKEYTSFVNYSRISKQVEDRRKKTFAQKQNRIKQIFYKNAIALDGRYFFAQPMRINLMQKYY